MKSVKSKDNKSTELNLIKIFKKYHIKGWQRNYRITGNPDFIFKKNKIALFADGCFWHGHKCRNIIPKDNAEYWNFKRKRNKRRDKIINTRLLKRGWRVIRIWECELKNKNIEKLLRKINILI